MSSIAVTKTKDDIQALLDQVEQNVFTDIPVAQDLLALVNKELKKLPDPEVRFRYHLNSALVENHKYNFELAAKHYEHAIDLFEKVGAGAKEVAETYIDYSAILININDEKKTKKCLTEAAKILESFPDSRLLFRLYCREAFYMLYFFSNHVKALEKLYRSQETFEEIPASDLTVKDYYFLTLVKSGLGEIYRKTGEWEKSAAAHLEIVQLCEEMGMKSRMAWHYHNLGNAYMLLLDYDSASEYFTKAIKATYDVSQKVRALSYANLGYCFAQKEKYREAIELFKHAEMLMQGDATNLGKIEQWRADIYNKLGRRKWELRHLKLARKYALQGKDKRSLASILKKLAAWYAQELEFEKAYAFQKEYETVSEQFYLEEKEIELRELEIKYEAERKEKEAEMLRLQAIGLQMKALRAQMNPHFLFNCLNSIQSYITSKDAGKATIYLSKFAMLIRHSLDYSELEVISIADEKKFLEDYLDINEKLRFENKMRYEIKMDDEIDDDLLGIPTMIIQPYVENAIEHGISPKKDGLGVVSLEFVLEDDETILCIIEDNGIGRDAARRLQAESGYKKHTSLGTKITRERLELLWKSFGENVMEPVKIVDRYTPEGTPCGTRVEIRLPIMELPISPHRNHKEL